MADEETTPGTDYVRPDDQRPTAPNPFDNGTAEPAPEVGQPNGTPLEEVVANTPPEVYDSSVPEDLGDRPTAKSLGIDDAVGAGQPIEAETVPAVAPTGHVGDVTLTAEQVGSDPAAVTEAQREATDGDEDTY